jgi:carboxymethylenebutenolidase
MPYADITKPPAPLPSAELQVLKPGLSLQPPLTRRGTGPGLIVLTTADIYDEKVAERDDAPTAVLRWAEEGYTVVQMSASTIESLGVETVFTEAISALDKCDVCQPKDKVGLICKSKFLELSTLQILTDFPGYSNGLWETASPVLARYPTIAASVVYVGSQNAPELVDGPTPLLKHIGGSSVEASPAAKKGRIKTYTYPKTKGQWFSPGHDDFDYASDSVAHTRNLQFLKPKMNGPYFDLEDIWEEHTYYEFADRSVEHTMSTMVQEPYVNHVPTVSSPPTPIGMLLVIL